MRMIIEIEVPDNAAEAILHHRTKWSKRTDEIDPKKWLGTWLEKKVNRWVLVMENETAGEGCHPNQIRRGDAG